MSYGPLSIFVLTMASGGTTTSNINLARSWKSLYLEVPSMNSNSEVHIYGSTDDSSFRKIYHPAPNSVVISGNQFKISSAVTNSFIPIPNGVRSLKIITTATIDNGCVFKIVCSD